MNEKDFSCFFAETVASTMDMAKKIREQKPPGDQSIFAVMAKQQTAGRGRENRPWVQAIDVEQGQKAGSFAETCVFETLGDVFSADATDFFPVTFVFPASRVAISPEWVTAAVGCALYDALLATRNFLCSTFFLTSQQGEDPFFKIFLKWPNDIVFFPSGLTTQDVASLPLQYKKICGILCESSSVQGKHDSFFLGIGVNFFAAPDIEKAGSFFASLFSPEKTKSGKKEIKKLLSRLDFRQAVLKKFAECCVLELAEYLCVARSNEQLRSLVLERSLPLGTWLSVNHDSVRGAFSGLDLQGGLLLAGAKAPIFSGDVAISEGGAFSGDGLHQTAPTITIDFGNSRVHLSLDKPVDSHTQIDLEWSLFVDIRHSLLREKLRPVLEALVPYRRGQLDILYTTVNTYEKTHDCLEKLKQFLLSLFPELSLFDYSVGESDIFDLLPIGGNLEKGRIGTDRALKFIFAAEQAKKQGQNIVVFSFGTAVTCEGVSAEQNLIENFVFPGIQMSLNAIHHFTALVPLFQANADLFAAGDRPWTQEVYVQRGVFLSVVATVATTLRLHAPCVCYVAGGNATEVKFLLDKVFSDEMFDIRLSPGLETRVLLAHKQQLLAKKKRSSAAWAAPFSSLVKE